MATNKIASVVVFDVGVSTSNLVEKETFFKKSQWCLLRMIQRIIFSDENDEFGVVLFGSKETENALALTSNAGNFSNIVEFSPLCKPDWDLYEKIQQLKPTTETNSNWLEGITVGLQFLKDSSRGRKYKNKQLIVFSNFVKNISSSISEFKSLTESFNDESISLVVIGVDFDVDNKDSKLPTCKKNLISMIETVDTGVTLSFTDAEDQVVYYQRKRKLARFTKVDLTIGSSIKIPIRWLKINLPPNRIKWVMKPPKKVAGLDYGESNNEPEVEFKFATQIQKRAKFGDSEVLLNYADVEAMKRKTGACSCILLGCVKSYRIPRKFFINQDIYLVVPEKNPKNAQTMLSAFIDALIEADKYALVRRVLMRNGRIKLGVMIPVSNDSLKELYFMQLPFAEYATVVPNVLLPEPDNQELLDTFDELINKMTILDEPKNVPMKDPTFQQRCHILSLYQTGQLSKVDETTPVPDFIKKLCDPYPELRDDALLMIKKLQELTPVRIEDSTWDDSAKLPVKIPIVDSKNVFQTDNAGQEIFINKPETSKDVKEDWETIETQEWPQELHDKYKSKDFKIEMPAINFNDNSLKKNKYETNFISDKIWKEYGKAESSKTPDEDKMEYDSGVRQMLEEKQDTQISVDTAEMLQRIEDQFENA